ncbi:MAG: hypothetical protein DMG87_01830 [Acidobacteria bacterium]|nr:MAG: hypothetical protein DMG87_01830 [Acidobacteriota bacterium]
MPILLIDRAFAFCSFSDGVEELSIQRDVAKTHFMPIPSTARDLAVFRTAKMSFSAAEVGPNQEQK